MSSWLLRLILPLTTFVMLLIVLMSAFGRLLPPTQIVPIVTYDSPTILLIDVNRHIAAARRTNAGVIFDAVVSQYQQQIAFSMADNRRINIYAGGLYDNAPHVITHDLLGGDNPAWSPDSREIAFVGMEPDNKRGIYTIAANGDPSLQTIVKAGTFASPAWSPDGRQLIFAASRYRDLPDLFVVNAECHLRCDRQMIQITNELVVDTSPVWSPDGGRVAFLSDRSGDYEIYQLDMGCLQASPPKCSLQEPVRVRLKRSIVPFLIIWSLDSHELYFRGWDSISNQPGLYAVKSDCSSLPEGCQPRMIYNLVHVVQGKRN